MGGSEMEHDQTAVRKKSQMEYGWMESNGSWVVMVSVGAEDDLGSEEREREEQEGM